MGPGERNAAIWSSLNLDLRLNPHLTALPRRFPAMRPQSV
jgi:hypothetical protein